MLKKIKQAIQSLFAGQHGAILSDDRFNKVLTHDDPRLTQIICLANICAWLRKNIIDVIDCTPEELELIQKAFEDFTSTVII